MSKKVKSKKPATKPPAISTLDAVEQYARDVVERREIAGPLVRLACQRHLDDLRDGAARGLLWDWPAAERVFGYFEHVLKLAGGEAEGKDFILHSSQKFIVGSLFGWKTADGARRFRVAYIEIAKGNGKSPLAAGIGLYMLTADGENRAEVYAAAVDKDQARILFRDAVAMVDQSEELDARITRSGGVGKEWNLAFLERSSFFRPISSESRGRGKSGPRPHCALLDEVHEHPTDAMVEFMRAGTKGRKQALILMITNSGVVDPTAVCYVYHEYVTRLMHGLEVNDSFFGFVAGLDGPRKETAADGTVTEIPGDSWTDPAVWRKANPLLGVSITEKYLQEQVREALGMPSKASLVRRLNFCEWVESADPFIELDLWNANGGEVNVEALAGRSCVGGVDLSGKNDLSSVTLVFDEDDDGKKDVLAFFWTPEEGVAERAKRDKAPYEMWIGDGLLTTTPGPTIDYAFIAQQIGELTKRYHIRAVAFDRWRIDDLRRELESEGVDVDLVEHGQGFKDMDPSIEALEDGLKKRKFRHGQNAILTTCVFNVRVEKNAAGLRMFSKRKATGRIDGAVSFCMAEGLSVSFAQPVEPGATWI